jgi:hypothetical protein
VGTLDVRSGGDNGSDSRHLWLAAGATLRVRWMLGYAAFFEGEGGVLIPIARERFFAEPSNDIFVVPAAAGTAGLDVGVFFL